MTENCFALSSPCGLLNCQKYRHRRTGNHHNYPSKKLQKLNLCCITYIHTETVKSSDSAHDSKLCYFIAKKYRPKFNRMEAFYENNCGTTKERRYIL